MSIVKPYLGCSGRIVDLLVLRRDCLAIQMTLNRFDMSQDGLTATSVKGGMAENVTHRPRRG